MKIENLVIYLNLYTPMKDYHNIKLKGQDAANIIEGLKEASDNPGRKMILTFNYYGKTHVVFNEILQNSIIEYTAYEKHWWGLKRI